MVLFWFYFSDCVKQDYKNKNFATGDWSQSTSQTVIIDIYRLIIDIKNVSENDWSEKR